jgi:hypothetical protein
MHTLAYISNGAAAARDFIVCADCIARERREREKRNHALRDYTYVQVCQGSVRDVIGGLSGRRGQVLTPSL